MSYKSPWAFAAKNNVDYITPEDITESIKSGYPKHLLWEVVLNAIADKRCEDYSLCAFIASRFDRSKE